MTTVIDCAGNELQIRSLKNDIEMGLSKEPIVINLLQEYFKEEIKDTKELGVYCPYDAYSVNTKYEIKSRRCRFETYDTTIIGVHKTKTEGRLVFVFNFVNGLYYIEYNKELFSTFDIAPITVYRKGSRPTPTPHFKIPTHLLRQIVI
jgi:hypothetical protein